MTLEKKPETRELEKKAIISNKIYINASMEGRLRRKLDDALTYSIKQYPSPIPRIIKHCGIVNDRVVTIPVGRTDLIPEDFIVKDKRITVDEPIPDPAFTLRDTQELAVEWYAETGRGIIEAKPGWGKSIAALAIAHMLQQKTLIVCTTTNIRDMWSKEIEAQFGFEPGIVGGGKYNVDPPIVVGNIQTLNKHSIKLGNMFGFIIQDEMHHCTASTFTNLLALSKARYRLGLSGTPKRKDGLHIAFDDYFGSDRYVPAVENTIPPEIHRYQTKFELSSNQYIPWANKVNEVLNNQDYRLFILALAKGYLSLGHKVLVVADRTEFLEGLHEHVETSILITGDVEQESRDGLLHAIHTGQANCIFATQSIFSEGVNVPPLSCLIMGTPVNNEGLIEQLAGRVMRMHPGKEECIVVDIGLKGSTARNQTRSRSTTYFDNGWEVRDYDVGKLAQAVRLKSLKN